MTLQQWNDEVDRLEGIFKNTDLPKRDIIVKDGIIHDVSEYINANIACARANAGNHTFESCITRLWELKQLLLDNR